MNSTNTIHPKSCTYGCGLQIYWNSDYNQYWEVFNQKKHICPNRSNKQITNPSSTTTAGATTKPTTYYNNKPWSNTTPKPKMSNSFEYLQGSIAEIQKKYEVLSDIVIVEHNGKIHGSQQNRDPKTGLLDLLVYYEVPLGIRDEVKRKFSDFTIRSQAVVNNNNNRNG